MLRHERKDYSREKHWLLCLRQLRRQFGDLPADLEAVIRQLPPTQIEILAEALLEFATLEDLRGWLRNLGEGQSSFSKDLQTSVKEAQES